MAALHALARLVQRQRAGRAARPHGVDAAAAPGSGLGHRRLRRMTAVPTDENRIQQVTIGRQQIRVAIRPGSAECTPLVIANGIGASLELLQPFVDALDPAIEVIRFDVPGVGGSPPGSYLYTLAGLARLLGMALTGLGYRHVDILGISRGGQLAQQFAVQNPRRCRRLVLVSTTTGTLMIPADPRVLAALLTQRRYRDPDYAAAVAGKLYGGSLRTDPGQAPGILQHQVRPDNRTGYTYQLLAGASWTSLPFLPLIRQRTLVVAGRDDPIIPVANAHLMAALIPRAQKLIHDDGHLALVTRATQLAPEISDFLLSSTTSIESKFDRGRRGHNGLAHHRKVAHERSR